MTVDPVAMVVAYVMLIKEVLMHKTRLSLPGPELNVAVFVGITVIVPVAVFGEAEHPPVMVTV